MAKHNWQALKAASRIGLMGHVIADYPSPEAVRAMIGIMAAAGARVIEIQIPFSEPMADGPLFLAANHAALKQGVDYQAALKLMGEVSALYPAVHFVFMSYLNVIYQRGYEAFVGEATARGAAGVIVPDLPVEHAVELEAAGARAGLVNIRILAPNGDDQRLAELTHGAAGLFYAVARAGVTGAASDFSTVRSFVDRIRAHSELPIAVGFGVRGASDVEALRGVADLAVIGTASLQAYQQRQLDGVRELWQGMAAVL